MNWMEEVDKLTPAEVIEVAKLFASFQPLDWNAAFVRCIDLCHYEIVLNECGELDRPPLSMDVPPPDPTSPSPYPYPAYIVKKDLLRHRKGKLQS